MKKQKNMTRAGGATVLAALIAAGFSLPAQAQSNVSIYGYLDVAIDNVGGASTGNVNGGGNGGRTTAMAEGYRNWLGFAGAEDLGDGMRATLNLQIRFQPGTGTLEEPGGTFFQGESTVGLSDSEIGSLRLGRAPTPLWVQKLAFDPWYDSDYMGSVGAYQNGSYNSDPSYSMYYANWARVSNALFFDSNDIGGFKLHVASQVDVTACAPTAAVACSTEVPNRRTESVALNYKSGPVAAMLSYEHNDVGDTIAMLAGAYNFGALTLMGTAANVNLDTLYNPGAPTEHDFTLAGTYALTGRDTVRFGYGHDADIAQQINGTVYGGVNGVGLAPVGGKQSKVSIGDSHALSKRTNVYADIWREMATTALLSTGFGVGVNTTF